MRGFGEIARLCASPGRTIGVVTAVAAVAHRARRRHRRRGPGQGRAGRGAAGRRHGDPQRRRRARARRWPAQTGAAVVTFGRAGDADVRIDDVALDELARPSFTVAHAVGDAPTSRSRSAAAHGRQRRGGARRRRRARRRPRRRRRRRSAGAELSAMRMAGRAGWRPGASSSTTPTTPTRRRWAPRSTRSPAIDGATGASPCSG